MEDREWKYRKMSVVQFSLHLSAFNLTPVSLLRLHVCKCIQALDLSPYCYTVPAIDQPLFEEAGLTHGGRPSSAMMRSIQHYNVQAAKGCFLISYSWLKDLVILREFHPQYRNNNDNNNKSPIIWKTLCSVSIS